MRAHSNSVRFPVQILALGILLVSNQRAFAVRLVRFEVSIDGKVVMETSTGDNGEDADTVWRYLNDLQLRPVKGFMVEPDSDDVLRATLAGKVIIHVDVGGRAEVSQLHLVRAKQDAPWKIASSDVERTLKSRHKPIVFTVSLDGNAKLSTGLQTRTGATLDDADNVWRHLQRLDMLPIRQYKVEAHRDDPLHATLKGKVIIEVKSDGQSWGRAEVSELKLVREKLNARWKVDPTEVDRTFEARPKPK